MADPFLTVRHLRKTYLETRAVDDVSFDIAPGEVVGLVGKNGAGKSTVIKMLAGAVTPDEGAIAIDGAPVEIRSPHQAHQLGLAFMHQELEQMPRMSVAENLIMGSRPPRRLGVLLDWPELRRISRSLTELIDRDIDPRTMIDELSVADKRLIMIARALHMRARLLVLDEPTASLTEREIVHLHAIVRRVQARGGSIVYVSHRLDEILELTDRVVVMRDGKVVQQAVTADLDGAGLVRAITGERIAALEAGATETVKRERTVSRDARVVLDVQGMTREGAVHDASFQVRAGEILGIAGLVGSGRTELVRMVFGADARDAGSVSVNGKRADAKQPADAIKAGIALLPEDRRHEGLVLDFGVRANVTLASLGRFAGGVPGFPSRRNESKASHSASRRLHIKAADQEQPVRHLSGGNQQKVVLGKWLTRGAEVFIFDEPTAGIDVDAKAHIYELAEALADDGKAVVFISSEFEELATVCTRVIVMREGRLVGELAGAEIATETMVALCYEVAEAQAGAA